MTYTEANDKAKPAGEKTALLPRKSAEHSTSPSRDTAPPAISKSAPLPPQGQSGMPPGSSATNPDPMPRSQEGVKDGVTPGLDRTQGGESQKLFTNLLDQLEPLLRRSQFNEADQWLNAKSRDPAMADRRDWMEKLRTDMGEVLALRGQAMTALRAQTGSMVTLKNGMLKGVVSASSDPERVSLKLQEHGPEIILSTGQLALEDVRSLVPVGDGAEKGRNSLRHGLLLLFAGDYGQAEELFRQAREAGLASAVSPYMQWIAARKNEQKEQAACAAWEAAEKLFAGKDWKAAKAAFDGFQRDHSGTSAQVSRAEALHLRMAAIDKALAAAEGFNFDFETADHFERFKRFLAIRGKPNNMEMKYEPGKILFRAEDTDSMSGICLEADTVKLGTHWQMSYRVNTKIDQREASLGVSRTAVMDVRFRNSENGTLNGVWDHARFMLYVSSMYDLSLFFQLRGPGENPSSTLSNSIFAGMKSRGLSATGFLNNGKLKNPASPDGVYDVKMTMKDSHIKITVNEMDIVDDELPELAVRDIQGSPLTLYIWFYKGHNDLELQRFSFRWLPK